MRVTLETRDVFLEGKAEAWGGLARLVDRVERWWGRRIIRHRKHCGFMMSDSRARKQSIASLTLLDV